MEKIKNVTAVKQENLMIHMKTTTRIKLEIVARDHGITMSWIIRSLIQTYLRENKIPPVTSRPRQFNCPTIRFNVCFYNNKNELQNWIKAGGQEFGPVIRYILELWEDGKLEVDFDDLDIIKEHYNSIFLYKSIKREGIRYGYQYQFSTETFKLSDYWLKNREGNIYLMEKGIKNRIYPLL